MNGFEIMFWYIAGLLTIPALMGLFSFAIVALARDVGSGPCYVCDHLAERGIGDQFHFQYWARNFWHKWFWSKRTWHKQAWSVHPANRRRIRQP